jgi:divalent metal cation (Fe/Co/Zn/Cd) transporter
MLIYVTQGGSSVSSLSVVTHAIGFLIANSALAIAIILNLMSYYTIFCCIYDLIKHLRDRAIEDDLKEKAFEEIVDDKEKIDYKDKDKEEIDIRKSLKRGDDEMTV